MSFVILEPRGLYFPEGKPVITAPSPEQLAVFPDDPRVEYFSTFGPGPEFVDMKIRGYRSFGRPTLFEERVVHPLAGRIREEFSDHQDVVSEQGMIFLRATAVSLDGPIRYNKRKNAFGEIEEVDRVFRDLDQVLRDGTDTGERKTRVTGSELSWADEMFFGLASSFTHEHARIFRETLHLNDLPQESVFPVVLVYSPKADPVGGLWIELPEDVEARKKILLKAYILDYPNDFRA